MFAVMQNLENFWFLEHDLIFVKKSLMDDELLLFGIFGVVLNAIMGFAFA